MLKAMGHPRRHSIRERANAARGHTKRPHPRRIIFGGIILSYLTSENNTLIIRDPTKMQDCLLHESTSVSQYNPPEDAVSQSIIKPTKQRAVSVSSSTFTPIDFER